MFIFHVHVHVTSACACACACSCSYSYSCSCSCSCSRVFVYVSSDSPTSMDLMCAVPGPTGPCKRDLNCKQHALQDKRKVQRSQPFDVTRRTDMDMAFAQSSGCKHGVGCLCACISRCLWPRVHAFFPIASCVLIWWLLYWLCPCTMYIKHRHWKLSWRNNKMPKAWPPHQHQPQARGQELRGLVSQRCSCLCHTIPCHIMCMCTSCPCHMYFTLYDMMCVLLLLTCRQMSHGVTCHMSHTTCHMSRLMFYA